MGRKVEPFVPSDPEHARMYVCGPTVYSYAHIGNELKELGAFNQTSESDSDKTNTNSKGVSEKAKQQLQADKQKKEEARNKKRNSASPPTNVSKKDPVSAFDPLSMGDDDFEKEWDKLGIQIL